jgi:1A family penicillin-binding protein
MLSVITIIAVAPTIWIFSGLPTIRELPDNLAKPSLRITDRHGRILYEILDTYGGRHSPVDFESIPEVLIDATIATEDRFFFTNPGLDFYGIIRAFWINIRGGETLAGGSTITQQVARNLLLSVDERFDRTIRRKLRESILAWQLTKNYSKEKILELYLNQMYYGGLAYGVEAASQTYFGKTVAELDLAESALIAGIPQGPAIYNPLVDPIAAKNRQTIVLEIMRNQGIITTEAYALALRQPLAYTPSPYPIEAPHFVMMVISRLDTIFSKWESNPSQTLVIRTTLDLDWQHLAEDSIRKQLTALQDTNPNISSGGTDQGHSVPGGHNVNNAALIALNPETGEILTMVGSPDYFDSQRSGAINMSLSPRQPGSALKPFVYAAAFDPAKDNPITPATMILDVQTTFVTHEGDAYTPANYDNLEHGPVSAREALASSLNIPAVILLDRVGLPEIIDLASKAGISTFGNPDDYDLSIALGGGEVTLLELTGAYASFANQGFRVEPISILEISELNGDVIYQHQFQIQNQIMDERVTWLISDILNDNDARSIGFGPNTALNIDRPAAVKTGTTTNYHDNWTVGYTPDIVVGVWVGNANHEPMRAVSGLSGAGPIWHQFIREALTGIPERWFIHPQGVVQKEVCAISGLLPTDDCPLNKLEWFIAGTEPVTSDNIYHRVWIDIVTGRLAAEDTSPSLKNEISVFDLPPQAHNWARSQGLILLSDLQQKGELVNSTGSTNPIQIIAPGNGSQYRLNSTVDPNAQRLLIQVATSLDLEEINLWLNGSLLKILVDPPWQFWWPLESGEHTLRASGSTTSGDSLQTQEISFSVLDDSSP